MWKYEGRISGSLGELSRGATNRSLSGVEATLGEVKSQKVGKSESRKSKSRKS